MEEFKLDRILNQIEPELRIEFFLFAGLLSKGTSLSELIELIQRGQIDQALRNLGRAADKLATAWGTAYNTAAQGAAKFLNRLRNVIVSYDMTNLRAVDAMRRNKLRLVRELTEVQRQVTRQALMAGILRGDNPRAQARNFRDSLGLSQSQQRALDNYRSALQNGDRAALRRALRDRRFDASVERAARGQALSAAQVDTMVGRYRDRLLKHRAEVIARTEALRSVHEGTHEMFQQAIDSGELNASDLVQTWNTAGDNRVRDSHTAMNGQERRWGEAFISGEGNRLLYPGDSSAPGSETIQCRCAVGTRIESLAGAGAISVTVINE